MTVNGQTIWENCKDAPNYNQEVIRPFDKPLAASGGIAVLRGNLAPTGAVLKPSAASPHLMRHRGRAVVFENIEHYNARIGDPDARRRRGLRAGAQELRAEGLSRAWRRSATWACRRRCCRPASPTWSAFPTRA